LTVDRLDALAINL